MMKRYLQLSAITFVLSVTILTIMGLSKASVFTGNNSLSTTQTTTSTSSSTNTTTSGTATQQSTVCTGTMSPSGASFTETAPGEIDVIGTLNSSCPTDLKVTEIKITNAPENTPADDRVCTSLDSTRPCPAISAGKFTFQWKLNNPTSPNGDSNITVGATVSNGTYSYGIPASIGNSLIVNAQSTTSSTPPTPCPTPTIAAKSNGLDLGNQPSVVQGTIVNIVSSVISAKVGVLYDPNSYETYIDSHTGLFDKTYNVTTSPAVNNRTAWDTTNVKPGSYTFKSISTCYTSDNYDKNSGYGALDVTVTAPPTTSNPNPTPPPTDPVNPPQTTIQTSSGQSVVATVPLLSNPTYKSVVTTPYTNQLVVSKVKPELTNTGVKSVDFSGKAAPDTKYQLFVFSNVEKLDVTTDKDGNWNVTLNSSLPAGHHEAYIVLNDKSGKPVQRSNVANFLIPTAQAAALASAGVTPQVAAVQRAKIYAIFSGLTVLVAVIVFAAFEAIKKRLAKKNSSNGPTPPNSPPPNQTPPPTSPTIIKPPIPPPATPGV